MTPIHVSNEADEMSKIAMYYSHIIDMYESFV
jgi:hypothetical protein